MLWGIGIYPQERENSWSPFSSTVDFGMEKSGNWTMTQLIKWLNISVSVVWMSKGFRKLKFHDWWLREKVRCTCNRRTIFKFILTISISKYTQ